jgi:hypothetical protein
LTLKVTEQYNYHKPQTKGIIQHLTVTLLPYRIQSSWSVVKRDFSYPGKRKDREGFGLKIDFKTDQLAGFGLVWVQGIHIEISPDFLKRI